MTPRERVLLAVDHQQPDRVPSDFWAEEPTMNRLFAHLGHADRERLLRDLKVDIRHLDALGPPERELGGGVYQNLWGERYIYKPTPWGPMREDVKGALAQANTLSDLEAFDWPSCDLLDYSGLPEQCRRHEQYALMYGFADIWQRPGLVRGWEGMFMDMAERPDWVHFLCRTFTDFYLADYTRAAEVCKGRIDIFLVISDLGGQSGPLMSLPMFRALVAPYLREMFDRIHSFGARVMFHSCGAMRGFIPDLIKMGVDILDPIQPTGPDMSPEGLAAEFGGQLCFHGGIDMQRLLPQASPTEVMAEVERYCQALGRGGGYILGPAHFFQPDVPPENVLAVYAAHR